MTTSRRRLARVERLEQSSTVGVHALDHPIRSQFAGWVNNLTPLERHLLLAELERPSRIVGDLTFQIDEAVAADALGGESEWRDRRDADAPEPLPPEAECQRIIGRALARMPEDGVRWCRYIEAHGLLLEQFPTVDELTLDLLIARAIGLGLAALVTPSWLERKRVWWARREGGS